MGAASRRAAFPAEATFAAEAGAEAGAVSVALGALAAAT
jgi:hypothetical protein